MTRYVVLLLAPLMACSLHPLGKRHVLEFRAGAIPEEYVGYEGVPMMPRDCPIPPLTQATHTLASGRGIEVVLGTGPRYELHVVPSDIDVTELPSVLDDSPSGFLATLPTSGETSGAVDFRRRFRHCLLVVLFDGEIVGLDEPGASWEKGVPGGLFPSRQALEATYRPIDGWRINELGKLDVSNERAWWQWRVERDFWELYCDTELRDQIRVENPEVYAEVMRRSSEIDCSSPPEEPTAPREAGPGPPN